METGVLRKVEKVARMRDTRNALNFDRTIWRKETIRKTKA